MRSKGGVGEGHGLAEHKYDLAQGYMNQYTFGYFKVEKWRYSLGNNTIKKHTILGQNPVELYVVKVLFTL